MLAQYVSKIGGWPDGTNDDVLILAASWEARCVGVSRLLNNYSCSTILLSVYDGESQQRETHIRELTDNLRSIGQLEIVPTMHGNPLQNIVSSISQIRALNLGRPPRISIDVSTFTRKHLLQLLLGLDSENFLTKCRFFHTEPLDYDTKDNGSLVEGISSVKAIEALSGWNASSKDSVLVLFLGYEGNRALALWEHIEPSQTIVVIPDPPYRPEWRGRTEDQNKYLLSCVPKHHVFYSSSYDLVETEILLDKVLKSGPFYQRKYKYQIAPLGTKAQTLGIYKFLRKNRNYCTVMYASATRYKHERANTQLGKTWYLGSTESWGGGVTTHGATTSTQEACAQSQDI